MKEKERFLEVFKKWYDYIGQYHHKDKDCHFQVFKLINNFSYGLENNNSQNDYIFYAFHHGYLLDDISTFFKTEEECYKHFIEKIENYIHSDEDEFMEPWT